LKTIFATSLEDMHKYFLPVEQIAIKLDVKTLFVWGEKDPFFPVSHAERMKAKMKNAELIIYKSVGHYVFLEETNKFVTDIKLFIKR
jgi:pimeloyl-ACP methyl ester carboxylesterase